MTSLQSALDALHFSHNGDDGKSIFVCVAGTEGEFDGHIMCHKNERRRLNSSIEGTPTLWTRSPPIFAKTLHKLSDIALRVLAHALERLAAESL